MTTYYNVWGLHFFLRFLVSPSSILLSLDLDPSPSCSVPFTVLDTSLPFLNVSTVLTPSLFVLKIVLLTIVTLLSYIRFCNNCLSVHYFSTSTSTSTSITTSSSTAVKG